jgi:hypothetical protein
VAEYTEPSNKQLANFLVVYAENLPAFQRIRLATGGSLNPAHLEMLLESNPEFREAGLRHHRQFVEQIDEITRKMAAGELPCEYIRPNGKRCPNYNEPGSMYCGLHKESNEE